MKALLQKKMILAILLINLLVIGREVCQAQNTPAAKGMEFNSEALWQNYDHLAFYNSLRESLHLDAEQFVNFRNYLEWHVCMRDRIDFFNKAGKGIINPMNLQAYFDRLWNKYYSLYPTFVQYSDSVRIANRNHPPDQAQLSALANCTQPCTNPGFEANSFNGWVQEQGQSSNVAPGGVVLSNGTSQTFITSSGNDALVGSALPRVFPGGGSHSAMVGDSSQTGAMAAGLKTTFLVTQSNANFTYAYAVVLQDGGHLASQQPFFNVVVRDQNGNIPPCGSYYVNAGPNIPNFFETSPGSSIWYRPWTSVFVDLTPYIGQCVSIEFITRDCTLGAHYGYAYVDASCSQPQVITSSASVCGGNTVTLTAPAGAAAYSWSGPGIVGSNSTQVITVNAAGTYTVVMTSSQGGCTSTLTITLTNVVMRPFALFTAPTVCTGTPTSFTDHSNGLQPITQWDWDFNNDGITDDTTQNPTHVFPAAGTYPVHLHINAPPCAADTTINVVVIGTPVAAFTSTPACLNAATVFTNTSTGGGNTWSWDFGDGNNSTSQNTSHTYSSIGTYTVTLTSTLNPGGCTNSVSHTVTVYPLPVPGFSATTVCDRQTTLFTNTSTISAPDTITSYAWNFADPVSGNYNTSSLVTPTHMFSGSGVFNVNLTLVSNHGCSANVTVPVTVNPLPVAVFNPTAGCINSPLLFTDLSTVTSPGSIASRSWNFGDASTSVVQNPSHTYTTAGSFTVTLVVVTNAGCVDTTTNVIVVNPPPTVKFSGDSLKHCTPWCVNFTDSSTVTGGSHLASWTWNFGDGTLPVTQLVPGVERHCYTAPGTYTVSLTVTTDQGCAASLTKPDYVTTWPIPEAAFHAAPDVATVDDPVVSFLDQSTGASTWSWTFGDNDTSYQHMTNPTHKYPSDNPGNYPVQLIVTNSYGCTDTAYGEIRIGPDFTFYIPNCFTPNGDGKNEFFFGYGVGIIQYELIIFDRWGNLIWKTNDLYSGWDGKVKGSSALAQEDVYVWKVNLTDVFNKQHNYIGHVSLVR